MKVVGNFLFSLFQKVGVNVSAILFIRFFSLIPHDVKCSLKLFKILHQLTCYKVRSSQKSSKSFVLTKSNYNEQSCFKKFRLFCPHTLDGSAGV